MSHLRKQQEEKAFFQLMEMPSVFLWNARLALCLWEREKFHKETVWDERRSLSLSRM